MDSLPFEWVQGELIEQAYIEIDGVKYYVTPARYDHGTSLSAYHLNRSEYETIKRLNGEILWTNPNPNVPFLPQEITLNESLVNYDCYEVIYLNTISEDRYYNTGKIPKGHGTGIFDTYPSLNIYGVGCRNREITYTSDTELTISEGKFSSGTGSQTVNNNACIPLYVIGYKTGLFGGQS